MSSKSFFLTLLLILMLPSLVLADRLSIYPPNRFNNLQVNNTATTDIGFVKNRLYIGASNQGEIYKDASNNLVFWDLNTGAKTLAQLAAAGSGDSVTVNSTAIDTTANIKDSTDITWAITDGGAGGPDDIAGSMTNAGVIGKVLTGFSSGAGAVAATDTIVQAFGKVDGNIGTKGTKAGDTWTGTHDFGGATSLETPNTAGDVTCDTAGEIAIDSTQKQLAWHDGTREVAISSDRKITAIITSGDWDLDSDKFIYELDTTIFPDGIVITKWTVDANVADPSVELNANLMYCDALANGAFPGANAVLIDVLDTTTGNSTETTMASSDLGSGTIPAGKLLYVDIDVDPATDTDFYVLQIWFYQPES